MNSHPLFLLSHRPNLNRCCKQVCLSLIVVFLSGVVWSRNKSLCGYDVHNITRMYACKRAANLTIGFRPSSPLFDMTLYALAKAEAPATQPKNKFLVILLWMLMWFDCQHHREASLELLPLEANAAQHRNSLAVQMLSHDRQR